MQQVVALYYLLQKDSFLHFNTLLFLQASNHEGVASAVGGDRTPTSISFTVLKKWAKLRKNWVNIHTTTRQLGEIC